MTKTFFKVWLIASLGHFIFMGVLLFYGFDLKPIDTGIPSPASKQIASQITRILMMPLVALWNMWTSKNIPNILEWILILFNSSLWGVVIAFIYSKYFPRKCVNNTT